MPSARDHTKERRPWALTLVAVVPATDSPPGLGRCLEALNAAAAPPDAIEVIKSPAGMGPAAARNAGAAGTDAELILFVDSDVVVHPDAIERVRAAFATDSELDAIFGAYDDAPAARGTVSRFRNLLHHHVHVSSAGAAETFWAGLGAVRREAFERVGGFDAARFPRPAVEDIDLGMRLRRTGARIRLDPEIRGTHLKRWTLGEMLRTDFARRALPWARLQLEAGRVGSELNLGWRHRVGALGSVLALTGVVVRRPRAAIAGTAAMVATHLPFYALLARRGGPAAAGTAVPLHALHHLTGVAAVAVALAAHLRSGVPK